MILNTIYGYKLWDSLFGIESITWEFSTDAEFNNIILSNTTNGDKLSTTLDLLDNLYPNIYCRVKINGYNGATDWFLAIEDKSDNIYITKGDDAYSEDISVNKIIVREFIKNKNGDIIFDLKFKETDKVIYLTKYKKTFDIDFLDTLKINTDWFFENTGNTEFGTYREDIFNSGDDYLVLPIINRFDEKVTSNIYHTCNIILENSYMEIKANFFKLENSYKYMIFKDIYNNDIITITNIDDMFKITLNGTEFNIPINIKDTDYLIGFTGNGEIYLNHKVEIYSGITIQNISSIHIGSIYENNIMETGEFKIDYIKCYKDTLINDVIAS